MSADLDSQVIDFIKQVTKAMGLEVDRKDVAGITTLMIEFPKTAGEDMEGLSAAEIGRASCRERVLYTV